MNAQTRQYQQLSNVVFAYPTVLRLIKERGEEMKVQGRDPGFWSWVSSLSVDERRSIFAITDPGIIEIIIHLTKNAAVAGAKSVEYGGERGSEGLFCTLIDSAKPLVTPLFPVSSATAPATGTVPKKSSISDYMLSYRSWGQIIGNSGGGGDTKNIMELCQLSMRLVTFTRLGPLVDEDLSPRSISSMYYILDPSLLRDLSLLQSLLDTAVSLYLTCPISIAPPTTAAGRTEEKGGKGTITPVSTTEMRLFSLGAMMALHIKHAALKHYEGFLRTSRVNLLPQIPFPTLQILAGHWDTLTVEQRTEYVGSSDEVGERLASKGSSFATSKESAAAFTTFVNAMVSGPPYNVIDLFKELDVSLGASFVSELCCLTTEQWNSPLLDIKVEVLRRVQELTVDYNADKLLEVERTEEENRVRQSEKLKKKKSKRREREKARREQEGEALLRGQMVKEVVDGILDSIMNRITSRTVVITSSTASEGSSDFGIVSSGNGNGTVWDDEDGGEGAGGIITSASTPMSLSEGKKKKKKKNKQKLGGDDTTVTPVPPSSMVTSSEEVEGKGSLKGGGMAAKEEDATGDEEGGGRDLAASTSYPTSDAMVTTGLGEVAPTSDHHSNNRLSTNSVTVTVGDTESDSNYMKLLDEASYRKYSGSLTVNTTTTTASEGLVVEEEVDDGSGGGNGNGTRPPSRSSSSASHNSSHTTALATHSMAPIAVSPAGDIFSESSAPAPSSSIVEQPSVLKSIPSATILELHENIVDMSYALQYIAKCRRPQQLAIIGKIREAVSTLWPGSRVEIYGSFATGLSAPNSDVDLVVCGVFEHYASVLSGSVTTTNCMGALASYLKAQEWVQSLNAVNTASVPVIKICAVFEGGGAVNKFDITFDAPSHRGLATCALVRRLLVDFKALLPLTLVLKQLLVEKGLNDSYTGGLSSYGLVLMIASVLQQYKLIGDENYGRMLIMFLSIFSSFNPRKEAIFLRNMGVRFPITEADPAFHADPLVLEDPLFRGNNVGRSCFGIAQVLEKFGEALNFIVRGKDTDATSSEYTILGVIFGTNHHRNVIRFAAMTFFPPMAPPRDRQPREAEQNASPQKTHKAVKNMYRYSKRRAQAPDDGGGGVNSPSFVYYPETPPVTIDRSAEYNYKYSNESGWMHDTLQNRSNHIRYNTSQHPSSSQPPQYMDYPDFSNVGPKYSNVRYSQHSLSPSRPYSAGSTNSSSSTSKLPPMSKSSSDLHELSLAAAATSLEREEEEAGEMKNETEQWGVRALNLLTILRDKTVVNGTACLACNSVEIHDLLCPIALLLSSHPRQLGSVNKV